MTSVNAEKKSFTLIYLDDSVTSYSVLSEEQNPSSPLFTSSCRAPIFSSGNNKSCALGAMISILVLINSTDYVLEKGRVRVTGRQMCDKVPLTYVLCLGGTSKEFSVAETRLNFPCAVSFP